MRTLTKLLWILLLGVVFSCQDNVIDAIDATIDEKKTLIRKCMRLLYL